MAEAEQLMTTVGAFVLDVDGFERHFFETGLVGCGVA